MPSLQIIGVLSDFSVRKTVCYKSSQIGLHGVGEQPPACVPLRISGLCASNLLATILVDVVHTLSQV